MERRKLYGIALIVVGALLLIYLYSVSMNLYCSMVFLPYLNGTFSYTVSWNGICTTMTQLWDIVLVLSLAFIAVGLFSIFRCK